MMATLLLITRKDRRRGNWRRTSTVNEYIGAKLALEVDGLCGYVQCQKDTYQVLQETIAAPINDALLRIQQAKQVTTCKDLTDVDDDGKPRIKLCWGNIHTHADVLASADVELFMTGDLAFYAMMLGKEHMAPHWCWRCPMSKAEWTSMEGPRVHDDWTIESMSCHLAKLQSGDLRKDKSEQQRGIKDASLTCIPPRNVIVPPLHANELFVNHPINKGFMVWAHCRIEQLPLELINA